MPKKDGSLRFCVDFRRLNAMTKKDVYPLPRVDDILDTLGDAKYFTTLDLASGYWQVPLDDQSRPKTAFTTHQGLFEFVHMPFAFVTCRCHVKMGTPKLETPGPFFYMKLGTPVPIFIIFWGPQGPYFHMRLGTLP